MKITGNNWNTFKNTKILSRNFLSFAIKEDDSEETYLTSPPYHDMIYEVGLEVLTQTRKSRGYHKCSARSISHVSAYTNEREALFPVKTQFLIVAYTNRVGIAEAEEPKHIFSLVEI